MTHLEVNLLLEGHTLRNACKVKTIAVNVCNGGQTEYCNPNWVPFANMDQVILS